MSSSLIKPHKMPGLDQACLGDYNIFMVRTFYDFNSLNGVLLLGLNCWPVLKEKLSCHQPQNIQTETMDKKGV